MGPHRRIHEWPVIEDSSSNNWGTEEAKHLIDSDSWIIIETKQTGDSEARTFQSVPELVNKYDYKELALATGYFSEGRSLGQGAFGAVYYGTLNGSRVAIKKLFYREKQEKQFESEVSVLAKLKHPNLVKMLGYCCDEQNNRLLVSEFMPNNSLASHLHGSHKPVLDWTKRMKVVVGSANGIAFLHNQYS